MRNLISLFLYMSLAGTASFLVYLLWTKIFGKWMRAGTCYRILKLCILLYLFPFPLLKYWIVRQIIYMNGGVSDTGVFYTDETIFQIGDNLVYRPPGKSAEVFWVTWGIVMFCIMVWRLWHYLRFRQKIMRQAVSVFPEDGFMENKHQLGIRRDVTILRSDSEVSPFTMGIVKPVILLTGAVKKEDEELALLHELQHIRSRDFMIRFLVLFCVVLHFWNPFIYLFWKEIEEVQEYHCDEKMAETLPQEKKKKYGDMLIYVSVRPVTDSKTAVRLAKSGQRFLKRRIFRLVRPPRKKWSVVIMAWVMAIMAAGVPVAAYNPKTVYLGIEETLTDELLSPGVDWISFEYGEEELCPEDEKVFAYTDTYFISDDGEISWENISLEVSDEEIQSIQATCNHDYVSGRIKKHDKNTSGGCTVYTYSCKKCTKCGIIINLVLEDTHIYRTCTH